VVTSVKRQLKRVAEDALAPIAPLTWRMRPAPRLLVLMYHRVLPAEHPDRAIEQPGMYVSPATLAMHVTQLKRHFNIVHLDDWLRQAEAGQSLPQLSCALTFDDGWRDNFEYAFPVLRQHQCAATIFLVSGMTGTAAEFWPNRLARALTRLGPNDRFKAPLGDLLAPLIEEARAHGKWSLEILDRAVVTAKQLTEAQIIAALDEARAGEAGGETRTVLNEEELHLMAASGLVRFGSHTRTHYRLRGEIPSQVLDQEIAGSGAEIGASIGRAADLFCYPNGDLTTAAVDVVRQHYIGAVTTQKGWHTSGADPFLIRRIGVHEDISSRPAAFLARISGLP
jgi:peptidoglycan/xylan/chitin deacetylase (PgdA/CDA1 family)